MRLLLTAVLLTASSLTTAAQRCPTNLPQAEINACWESAAEETDQRLDGLLRELRRSLADRNWGRLHESQRHWEKSRELDCKIEASFIEGPVREAVVAGCHEKRARARMHQLRYYLCPRYNLTGQCDAQAAYE